MLNDVWGLRRDTQMPAVLARSGVPAVVMHNQRGRPFRDVIGDIREGLEASISLAESAGVPRERLIVDPGFGFGWKEEHNLEMVRRLGELKSLGLPILVGTSRKSTIGAVLDLPVEERLFGTAASVALAIANGADIVRVHDVREMLQVVRVADAVVRGWRRPEDRVGLSRDEAVFVGLGANLGNRAANLRMALRYVRRWRESTPCHLWETAPVGDVDQPNF
jgi:dihydropteroate synthase